MDITKEVYKIIADVCEISTDEITDDTAIGDFPQWDSLHHLRIIAEIEKVFNIRFTPDILMDLEDVNDIVNATKERVE